MKWKAMLKIYIFQLALSWFLQLSKSHHIYEPYFVITANDYNICHKSILDVTWFNWSEWAEWAGQSFSEAKWEKQRSIIRSIIFTKH